MGTDFAALPIVIGERPLKLSSVAARLPPLDIVRPHGRLMLRLECKQW